MTERLDFLGLFTSDTIEQASEGSFFVSLGSGPETSQNLQRASITSACLWAVNQARARTCQAISGAGSDASL